MYVQSLLLFDNLPIYLPTSQQQIYLLDIYEDLISQAQCSSEQTMRCRFLYTSDFDYKARLLTVLESLDI